MNEQLLTIAISQLQVYRDKAFNANFSGRRKSFFDSLSSFVDAFVSLPIGGRAVDEYKQLMLDVECIATWLKLLVEDERFSSECSTLYSFLDRLSRFWVPSYDDYILLVSNGEYAFGNYGCTINNKLFITELETRYSCVLNKIPVYLQVPDFLRTDILFGVALLHEIGHFYDFDKGIKQCVLHDFIDRIKNKSIPADEFLKFFPNGLKDLTSNPPMGLHFTVTNNGQSHEYEINERLCTNHIGEFIADLFAAQYVGLHIFDPIDYKGHDPNSSSMTHPSNAIRKSVVNDFLTNSSNTLLDVIKDNFGDAQFALSVKHSKIVDDKYCVGDDVEITNDEMLFTILHRAWDIYKAGPLEMQRKTGQKISYAELYKNINETFSKAIEHYII